MSSNAANLYRLIKDDPEHTQRLFRKALQDPQGTLDEICQLGESLGFPVTPKEVKDYLAGIEDSATKQWLFNARGGL